MPSNTIDVNGLTIQTITDVLNELENGADGYLGWYQIYGADVNLQPNSPDGQALNIFAQAKVDTLGFGRLVYTSFDPQQAFGVALDRVCAINGVIRNGGTYTQQVIAVTVSQALTLPGLDLNPSGGAFVVQDSTGTQYQLLTTYAFTGAGTVSLTFQAILIGAITSPVNGITVISTPQLGVVSVNNPTAAVVVGTNQETDAALRIRRANSVELPSLGYLQGLIGALQDVPGVTQAEVYENVTNTTDGRGIPAHSIWCIVAGSGAPAAIGNAIYVKRNAGCGQTSTGYGATATAAISGGAITGFTVGLGGAGYVLPPQVVITDPHGTGASGTAVLTSGVVTSITLGAGGSGYTAPVVALVGQTQVVPVTQVDGSIFDVLYDTPVALPLFFTAAITAITGTVDLTYIQAQILAQFGTTYLIGQTADATAIVAFIKSIAPNASVSGEGVSLTSSGYTPTVASTGANYQFYFPSGSNIILT
jgi:uncharacterized phage protein gp47/JayE